MCGNLSLCRRQFVVKFSSTGGAVENHVTCSNFSCTCTHSCTLAKQFLRGRGRGGPGRPGPGCLCLGVRGGVPWWRWRWPWRGFATAKAARKPIIHMCWDDHCNNIASHCMQTYLAEAEKLAISYPCLGGKGMNEPRSTHSRVF